MQKLAVYVPTNNGKFIWSLFYLFEETMTIREAKIEDIKQIQTVRNSVRENTLSNPNLVTDQDCEKFITVRGKAWVCEISSQIVGFAIVDLKENNIWALFIDPKFEKKGDRATITQNYAGLVFLQRQKKKFG